VFNLPTDITFLAIGGLVHGVTFSVSSPKVRILTPYLARLLPSVLPLLLCCHRTVLPF
jgi:hypothetical protein